MRTVASLAAAAVVFLAVSGGTAHAEGAPVARLEQAQAQAATLEAAAGAGAALAPRLTVERALPTGFGFQGPQVQARLTPPRPAVAPSAFRGFGGYAARAATDDLSGERHLVQVSDVVVEAPVLDGHVDACGRVYTTRRPAEVTHRSSYYVPHYRTYRGACGSSCRPCYTRCYRPCHRPCYRTYYVVRPCYAMYDRPWGWRSCGYGCGWGPYDGGLGWGLGVGIVAGW